MLLNRAVRFGWSSVVALALLTVLAPPVAAQNAPTGPSLTVTGGLDVTNQYNFRGIRQNTDGVSIWPFIDFGIGAYTGEGSLKTVTVNLGTWNAFHSQINDDDFDTGNKWYESDLYATVGVGFSKAALGFTYTSYTSPADLFAHVKELAVKLSVDDSAALGKGALKPYALVAFELTDDGQADAGGGKGTYVELGIAPGYAGSKASLAIPVKVGLSGSDYYEFATGSDSKFGYFSVGGLVTVPVGAKANIHGGLEFQAFGDNLKAYNGFGDDDDDPSGMAAIASLGIGFAF
jgi:hypothetical protein